MSVVAVVVLVVALLLLRLRARRARALSGTLAARPTFTLEPPRRRIGSLKGERL